MPFDTASMIRLLCITLVALGAMMFAWRIYLNRDAHWITKTLCEDTPVYNGSYRRCLEHYAPAAADFAPV